MSSLVLAHDAPELRLNHFETQSSYLLNQFGQAAHDALFAMQELVIETEMSIEEIAQRFGIRHFGLQIMAKSLSNCKIVLTTDSHLEIHRKDSQVTRFKVARNPKVAANDEKFAIAA